MKETISKKQLREFGILVGFGFPLLIGWVLPAISGHGFRAWTFFIGVPIFIIGFTAPYLLHYPYKAWMALGYALGWFNSKIILGLVFVFILQPIAFVMRLTGYDPLRSRRKRELTYKETRRNFNIDFTRIF